ncbi:MAG: gamma-glutamyl-gamma-aminobutyrate hydrolase family protein [Micrococcales bacterium]|nr:gamma-glutamyl-gamma-aminobutyrate hydrolase family protein [Micrococcales bacterium]
MKRPIIGITTYVEPASQGDWVDVPSALIPHAYIRAIERAGGIALLIPPRLDGDEALLGAVLERLDGAIITGGVDVAPELYATHRHPSVQIVRADRDMTEIALARAAARLDLPLLGICRGMQVMAVAAGGTLEQHLPDLVGHDDHAPAPATFGCHEVRTVAGTAIAGLLGPSVLVSSLHHQAVLTHPSFVPSAWAPDGVLEAMEDPSARWRLAIQWHPEVGTDPRLFDGLVAAARSYAAERGPTPA